MSSGIFADEAKSLYVNAFLGKVLEIVEVLGDELFLFFSRTAGQHFWSSQLNFVQGLFHAAFILAGPQPTYLSASAGETLEALLAGSMVQMMVAAYAIAVTIAIFTQGIVNLMFWL